MGLKNRIVQTEGDNDLQVKVGHGILKAIYTAETGDRNWIIREGVNVCPATGTITICSPVANTFSCAAISVLAPQEELTSEGTITVVCPTAQVEACGIITVLDCTCVPVATGQTHADIEITMVVPTVDSTSCGTVTASCPVACDTVNVNGRVYTAVCGAKDCTHTQFSICGTNCVIASCLNDSLNNDTRCPTCPCDTTTSLACAVITITSVLSTTAANCIVLTSNNNCTMAISACGFTGGKCTDTLTVDGNLYTAVAIAKMCDAEFDVSSGNNNTIATDLADSLDDDLRMCCGTYSAAAVCAVVTVTLDLAGAACGQNCTAVSDTAGGRITSPATFCCGVTGDTVTINGLLYIANCGTKATCPCLVDTEFDVSCTQCVAATDLADSIDDDLRLGTLFNLSATATCAVVTVVVNGCACDGFLGNCVAQSTSNVCAITVDALLTCGATADTVTVDGNVYTGVTGSKCCDDTLFSVCCTNCVIATDLADSIDDDTRCGTLMCIDVTATAGTNVVTIVSDTSGCAGNAMDLTTTDAATLAVNGCGTMTGGNDACTVTINGLIYTAVDTCNCACMGEFKVDCQTDTQIATSLACVVCMDARCGTCGDLSATSCTAIVTVTTDVCGVAGDCITIVSACMTTLNVGCGFEGGVDADTVTINDLVFTAVAGARCGNTQFSIDATDAATATDLAAAVTADARFPCCVAVPTHDVNGAAVAEVVTITADNGEVGGTIPLLSSSATRLLTSGTTLTGGQGREIIDLKLVGVTSGELSLNFLNTPMADGIFLEYISGTTGRLVIVFE